MARQQATRQHEDQEDAPTVRTPEESQLAIPEGHTLADAQSAVTATAEANNAAMQTFINWLVERADTTDEDQYALMASIMSEIIASANPDEVLREKSTMKAGDVVGQPLLLHGFEIRAGDYEESMLEHYAALTVSRPGAEGTRILTCGATKVLMKLYALDKHGEWPQAIMFTSKAGKKGNILDMVRP